MLGRFRKNKSQEDNEGEMSFSISATLFDGTNQKHRASVCLKPGLQGLHRIGAFVGMNGTGKTKILNAITIEIAGINQINGIKLDIKIEPKRPDFSRVFSSTFSSIDTEVFKEINFPEHCFLISITNRHESHKSNISLDAALKAIAGSEEIKSKLNTYIKILLGMDSSEYTNETVKKLLETEVNEFYDPSRRISGLSSGQKALVVFFVKLVSHLRDKSLILLDEPETHLHPAYIIRLFRALSMVCEDFNSYILLSTHSPLIIQNLPRQNISIMRLIDGIPSTTTPVIETFGESSNRIVEEIFGIIEENTFYRDILQLPECRDESGISREFPSGLGFRAKTVWETLRKSTEQ